MGGPYQLGPCPVPASRNVVVFLAPSLAAAGRRSQVAGDAALGDRYLADRRITPRTAANYRSAYNAFVFWAAQNDFSFSLQHLDNSLRKYLLHIFFDGGAAFDARYALHGTIFVRELRRAF